MIAIFKHFQSTSGEAAMERITRDDQDDNILSPRTSDISAAFDLTAKVLYCNKRGKQPIWSILPVFFHQYVAGPDGPQERSVGRRGLLPAAAEAATGQTGDHDEILPQPR